MRIRRKRHLGERLEAVSNVLYISDRDFPNVNEAVVNKKYFDFNQVFGNDNNVSMEIGCGKGGFIVQTASLSKNENFFAVELLENIIVMASESAIKQGLTNVKFFNCGADYLPRYVKPNSLSKVFLNFSPPFPGDRYENRRLTKDRLVENYKVFLKVGGQVVQKTDDKEFFEYSKRQFEKYGFAVQDITSMLAEKSIPNVQTEYEKKFCERGIKIYGLIATKKE